MTFSEAESYNREGLSKGGRQAPLWQPPFLRAALSVIACSDDTSPKGGGETWLSLWESWHDEVVTERAPFKKGGLSKGDEIPLWN